MVSVIVAITTAQYCWFSPYAYGDPLVIGRFEVELFKLEPGGKGSGPDGGGAGRIGNVLVGLKLPLSLG